MACVLQIVVLLPPPLSTKYPLYLRYMLMKNVDIKLSIHCLFETVQ
ncbi:8398_t:CDS:1, partial [Acaulospora morrowiae]